MRRVFRPALAVKAAAVEPAGPPPATTTSYCFIQRAHRLRRRPCVPSLSNEPGDRTLRDSPPVEAPSNGSPTIADRPREYPGLCEGRRQWPPTCEDQALALP